MIGQHIKVDIPSRLFFEFPGPKFRRQELGRDLGYIGESDVIRKDDKSKIKQGSIIGPGTHVAGQVFFSGELYVEGSVHGSVCAQPDQPARLVIGDQGRIDGEVRVAHLVVAGTINGEVTSSLVIEFRPNARVTGDVYYRRIEMRLGSIVEGRLTHQSAD